MFYDENPTHKLVRNLSGGAFGRGLPTDEELSAQPDVVAVFRKLLKNGTIVENDKNENEAKAIRKCHRHGWIHADESADEISTHYAFPSPLHSVCVSWSLPPTNDFRSLFGTLPSD